MGELFCDTVYGALGDNVDCKELEVELVYVGDTEVLRVSNPLGDSEIDVPGVFDRALKVLVVHTVSSPLGVEVNVNEIEGEDDHEEAIDMLDTSVEEKVGDEKLETLTVTRNGVAVNDIDTVELKVNVCEFISVKDAALVPERLGVPESELPAERVPMDMVTIEEIDMVEVLEIVDVTQVEGVENGDPDKVEVTERDVVAVTLAKELAVEVDERVVVPVEEAVSELEEVPDGQAVREDVVVDEKVVEEVKAPTLFVP